MITQLIADIKDFEKNSTLPDIYTENLKSHFGKPGYEVPSQLAGRLCDLTLTADHKLIAGAAAQLSKAGYPIRYYKNAKNACILCWITTSKGHIAYYSDWIAMDDLADFLPSPEPIKEPTLGELIGAIFRKLTRPF